MYSYLKNEIVHMILKKEKLGFGSMCKKLNNQIETFFEFFILRYDLKITSGIKC